ncbi:MULTISPECIES: hypothetical protein [unclassified Janthinobacterium]|uniref:hypothetical protein n=1 Tax=unclassified Janthinobacterium TaxID=2610881 RepID=UPI0008876463|nr:MULTISPECIES: hypothetical protein [unclassified Janthinobacterium]SDA71063.1 hypothetical protein SAMN03159349_03569 [Janthinobacterium sp. 551a]SFB55787.1 hypothetical protein SAMN03159300_107283 [Janthinobacterium sp. 344]
MIDLHYLLTLRHPRRFWCGAIVIAIASAILLGPWLDSTPWLVAIPFVAGGLLVALGELWEEIAGKQRPNGNGDAHPPCQRP